MGSTQSSQNGKLPHLSEATVWGPCGFSSGGNWKAGRRGELWLWVNADGWGRQLKGITSKALGAEEQTWCGPASAGGRRGGRQHAELLGMLTIMIASANPGVSRPAPHREETGYYLPPTGSDVLPRWANQRGDRGHFLRVAAALGKTAKTEDGEIAPGGGGYTGGIGIWTQCAVSRESSYCWGESQDFGVCEARQSQGEPGLCCPRDRSCTHR